jgi:predicted permease
MGIPLVNGRVFDDRDRADAPLVVTINQSLAKELWPGEDPIGRRISFPGQEGPWREIVGVVGDTRMVNMDTPPAPSMYLPHAQKPWSWLSWGALMVRTAPGQEQAAVVNAIRTAIQEQDPRLAIHRVATVPDLYREGNARRLFATMLLGGFAVIAVLLGMIGMYGVLSYTVAQRKREIGIRMALGAGEANVMRGVMRQALALTVGGVLFGTAVAVGLTRVLESLLFEVSATDPVTYVAVAALLIAVAAVSAWVPARRATRVDALTVIRE